MVAHEDIGIEREIITGLVVPQYTEIPVIVFPFFEDRLPLIAPGDDMIKGPFKLDPGSPCHGKRISVVPLIVNKQV